MRRLAVRAGATGLAATALTVAVATPAPARTSDRPRAERVLVVSLPDVEWADLQRLRLPNLGRLLAQSAIGGLVTNGVASPSPLGNNYATFSAGARASAPAAVAGQGFAVDEPFGRETAGSVFRARTGVDVRDGLVFMPISAVIDANDRARYGAEVGLLGDTLAEAGVRGAVIANGDGSDPSVPEVRVPPYRRAAVVALTTSDGTVPAGRVDRGLLRDDVGAPFGVRLDHDAVVDAFSAAWTGRSVVLVEASDLVRVEVTRRFSSDAQVERLRARALRATDELVGRILEHVDPARDAVLVVGAEPPAQQVALTPVALRAPGVEPGLLRSVTTRRDGFVNMVDVAPTILSLLAIPRPDAMDGRRMTAVPGDDLAGRVRYLVGANSDGRFRDRQVGASMIVVLVIVCVLTVATALVDRFRRGVAGLAMVALGLIGFLDATYLAGPFHFGRTGGPVAYWAFVGGVALLLAVAFLLAGRGNLIRSLLVALASVVALHVLDLLTGAHLEWNTVFGYSPTIGIRFSGQGNLAFAQLAAAAVLFAGVLVWQFPTAVARRSAVGVLAVTAVVMGVPVWGNDFGAVLSALPGFAVLAWMLLGHEVRARTVAAIVALVIAAVVAVGSLELLRPPDRRTHVGRFLRKVGTDPDGAWLVIRRKAAANLSVLGSSLLLGTIVAVALLVAYLWFVSPRSLRRVVDAMPTAPAVVIAFLVVAILGFAFNDSGISIPGMMFAVFQSALVVVMADAYSRAVPGTTPAPGAGEPVAVALARTP